MPLMSPVVKHFDDPCATSLSARLVQLASIKGGARKGETQLRIESETQKDTTQRKLCTDLSFFSSSLLFYFYFWLLCVFVQVFLHRPPD
jgi:hypothetical protein